MDAGHVSLGPRRVRGSRELVGRARLRRAASGEGAVGGVAGRRPDRRAGRTGWCARRGRWSAPRPRGGDSRLVTEVIFFLAAAFALAGALGVVLSRNPVHSALYLVVTLLSVAVFFIQQQAPLLAAVQIIVYAGA